MEVLVNILRRDGSQEEHVCSEFPYVDANFVTLYFDGMHRIIIRSETIEEIEYKARMKHA